MYKLVLAGFVVLALAVSPAMTATIVVGNHPIEAAPNQKVPIYVTGEAGDPTTAGTDFNVQTGGGGPDFGGEVAPIIQYVQLVDDPGDPHRNAFFTDEFGPTLFEPFANQGHFGTGSFGPNFPQMYHENTTLNVGGVSLVEGVPVLFAIVTLNGTGFDAGQVLSLEVSGTANGLTVLNDDTVQVDPIPLTVTDGTVTIIPEPSTFVLLLAGCLGILVWRRR